MPGLSPRLPRPTVEAEKVATLKAHPVEAQVYIPPAGSIARSLLYQVQGKR